MTENEEQAYRDAEDVASQVPELLAQVAEKLGVHAGASAVFGEPVEKGDRVVVPVAQSILGTGAGGGSGTDEGGGLGGGGGVVARPVGYIEVTSGEARFVPLTQPWADPRIILAYSLLALVIGRTIVKLARLAARTP